MRNERDHENVRVLEEFDMLKEASSEKREENVFIYRNLIAWKDVFSGAQNHKSRLVSVYLSRRAQLERSDEYRPSGSKLLWVLAAFFIGSITWRS